MRGENYLRNLRSLQGEIPREIKDEAAVLYELGLEIKDIEKIISEEVKRLK